ncbi:MAG: hypothetical protein JO113_07780, partial [Candidatus Eremiobacteraeota bacterium]|nr:hypothetical protein [Candidatus Eremiobacteraeota bacterium]
MRFLTAALCTTVAAALLAACSSNGSTSSSAIPGAGSGMSNASHWMGKAPMVPMNGHWVPLLHHGNIYEAIPVRIQNGKVKQNPPPGPTKGLYVQQFFTTTNSVEGYPKNNSANGPPDCTIASGTNVNDFGVDRNGVIIVPAAFSGIQIYQPPVTAGVCGSLVATIPESGGQATSAAAL